MALVAFLHSAQHNMMMDMSDPYLCWHQTHFYVDWTLQVITRFQITRVSRVESDTTLTFSSHYALMFIMFLVFTLVHALPVTLIRRYMMLIKSHLSLISSYNLPLLLHGFSDQTLRRKLELISVRINSIWPVVFYFIFQTTCQMVTHPTPRQAVLVKYTPCPRPCISPTET